MTVADERAQAELEARARKLGLQPWQLRAAEAVPTDVIRDLVNDFRRGPSQPSGIGKPEPKTARGGTGWIEPSTQRSRTADLAFDKLMQAQDAKDRAELEAKLAQKPKPKGG